MAAYAGKLPPCSCCCYCSFIHIYLECDCCWKGSRGFVCVCVRGSCAASSTELSKKMPPASPVLLSQRESIPTSLPSFSLFSLCHWVLMWESVLRERERESFLSFMRRILKTFSAAAAAACVDVAACPLPRPVFVFAFVFFIRFKGINLMKFVAQL